MEFTKLVKSSLGTDWLKLEGSKKLRFVSEFEGYQSLWDNEASKGYRLPYDYALPDLPSTIRVSNKFVVFAIDKTEPSNMRLVKLEVGQAIINQLGDLVADPDFGFTKYPPYDVKITRTGEGLKTKYAVMALPDKSKITPKLLEGQDFDSKALINSITKRGLEDFEEVKGNLAFAKTLES